jgi:DNA-binding NarL/FixJ family response regulator
VDEAHVTSILVAVAIRFYREGLTRLLDDTVGLRVCGTAGTPAAALLQAEKLRPSVVLLDFSVETSLRLAGQLANISPGVKVLPLGIADDESAVIAWAEAGVAGYITSDTSLLALLAAIRGADRGEALCSARIAATLLRQFPAIAAERPVPLATPAARLTRRELEIAYLLEEGLANKEIASRLQVGLPTVKNHVHAILEKLEVRGRTEAAACLRRAVAVDPGLPRLSLSAPE